MMFTEFTCDIGIHNTYFIALFENFRLV